MLSNLIHRMLDFFYPLVKKLLPYEVYVYMAVGAANTVLNIVLFIILYNVLNHMAFAVEVATMVSFVITVLTGFWLNKNFAFTNAANKKSEVQKQFGRYFLVSLQGQFSDYLITKALILVLAMHPNIAYIISTVIMLTVNYFLQKYYTFSTKKNTKP